MSIATDDPGSLVAVIDDDRGVREALEGLLQSVGLVTTSHASVQEYLDSNLANRAGCIVVDIRLPGRSGLEFQEALTKAGVSRSVVLISAHVDVQMAVRAMRAGAIDVLTKPVREQDLLEAINRGLAIDKQRREQAARDALLRAHYETLTERERQVLQLVATGLLNKQIAERVNVTEATVKLHRSQVMRKMEAGSIADLVRMADRLADMPPMREI